LPALQRNAPAAGIHAAQARDAQSRRRNDRSYVRLRQRRLRRQIHVGYDALDTYEDLDFDQRDVVVEGRAMTLHVPRALNSGFLAVTWDDPNSSLASCAGLTVTGRRVGERMLLDAAAGV